VLNGVQLNSVYTFSCALKIINLATAQTFKAMFEILQVVVIYTKDNDEAEIQAYHLS
jgi:hypothetical protein